MDLRRRRREKSRVAIAAALERLQRGLGTHPRHAGLRVRITKQAVAREARISPATLYRFPDLVEQIGNAMGQRSEQVARPAEQRRAQFIKRIEELENQVALLLGENLRLSRLLSQHDPTLGVKRPVSLNVERARRARST